MKKVGLMSWALFFVLVSIAFASGNYNNTEIGKILNSIGTPTQTETAKAPSPEKLCEYLVDVDGWKSGECDKLKMSGTPAGDILKVEKEYRNGDKNITIIIFNGVMAQSSWAPFASEVKVNNEKEFVEFSSIDGYRCGINYNKMEHKGSIVIPLTDDIKNKSPNAIMGVYFENVDYKDAIDFTKNFDVEALVHLFQ